MALLSGRDGKVLVGGATVADVSGWHFMTRAEGKTYASSATAGFRRRTSGARHGQGKLQGKLDRGAAIHEAFAEGDTVVLRLHLSPTHYYQVPAVIDALRLVVDVERDEVTGWEAEFTSDGAWTEPNWT
ncbi:MAG: hypothetical protein K1X74_00545 [Pirellulales bacterium]|nr:hypothetical protein [Pirellulales bacterium]